MGAVLRTSRIDDGLWTALASAGEDRVLGRVEEQHRRGLPGLRSLLEGVEPIVHVLHGLLAGLLVAGEGGKVGDVGPHCVPGVHDTAGALPVLLSA